MPTIEELRSQPHLSASAINEYMECSLSYRFSRIERVEPEFISDAMLLGSVMHKVLEAFHQSRWKEEKKISLEDLLQRFEQQWSETAKKQKEIRYKEGRSYESCLEEGRELIVLYHQRLPEDSFQILATELAFSFEIPGLPVPIVGVMDCVYLDDGGNLIIIDYKTSGRSYSKEEIDKSLQLTLYHMAALHDGYTEGEILLRFDCLIKTKTPKFEQYYTVRTAEDVQRAERKIQQVWNAIESGVFVPNDTSWKCSGCAYRQHCDRWFLQGKGGKDHA